MVSNVLKD
jgi:hypothetical protein